MEGKPIAARNESVGKKRPKRRNCLAGLVVGIVTVGSLFGTTGVAHAVTRDDGAGAGNVAFYQVEGRTGSTIYVPSPYVWRSPRTTGAQRIWVSYYIYRNDGKVLAPYPATFSLDIPSGAPGRWMPSYSKSVIGYKLPNQFTGFQVVMRVVWGTVNGGFLAQSDFFYEEVGDYRCTISYFCWADDQLWLI